MKEKFWKIVLGSIIFVVIAQIIHIVESMLTMGYYLMPDYANVWSKLMMPSAGPPPASFFLFSFLFGLVGAILFYIVYYVVQKSVPGKGLMKGLTYGCLFSLAGIIPGTLSMLLLINLPTMLLLSWLLSGFLINLINGMIAVKIMK